LFDLLAVYHDAWQVAGEVLFIVIDLLSAFTFDKVKKDPQFIEILLHELGSMYR